MRLQSPLRSGWGSALQRRGEGYSRGGQPSAIARARSGSPWKSAQPGTICWFGFPLLAECTAAVLMGCLTQCLHVWLLCRQFGGYAKEEDYVNYAAKLRSALGSEAAYRKDFYLCNGYDPPMKPYWRCNEVWFVME
ncbi:uncharacterized protein LOC115644289 isoform X2 [Gopherus evgoodei]|uniref:uncharacterized protein LOC115644289 isoform X2 n=1 Tax=Gopherus evgoodei TaxID=1825980 RepID=UPI0011CF6C8B|nr:uncharacterized protein LOC115644289 isoform X2 [Gopherus evgoodei]